MLQLNVCHLPLCVVDRHADIPEELVKQLRNGGRMVIPVGPAGGFHKLVVVDVGLDGKVSTTNLGVVRFVPLTSYEKQVTGSFFNSKD